MNNAVIRKRNLIKKIEDVNNNSLSLEGFFSNVFGSKKTPIKKEPLTLNTLINQIETADFVFINTQFDSVENYIKSLEDLEGPLLDFYSDNIERVSKFLNLLHKYKEKIDTHISEAKKIGSGETIAQRFKNNYIFKSKYYAGEFFYVNDTEALDIEEDIEQMTPMQKNIIKYPDLLSDIDFCVLHNVDSRKNVMIYLDYNEGSAQATMLISILKKINSKLTDLKPRAEALKLLFEETQVLFTDILKKISISEDLIDLEYIGFGGSMYQGLGYLYEINEGIEKDFFDEINIG